MSDVGQIGKDFICKWRAIDLAVSISTSVALVECCCFGISNAETSNLMDNISIGLILASMTWLICRWSCRCRLEHTAEYLLTQLAQIHFCGYKLSDVYLLKFFPRYRGFVDWGFCAPTAAMSMLALKNNKTARYVYALAGDDHCEHCWVEFRHGGGWYVVDVCWIYPFVLNRSSYYRKVKPEFLQICDYETFWSYPISSQFYEKMQDSSTSWLFCELIFAYSFGNYRKSRRLFDPEIETHALDKSSGKFLHPWLFYAYPEIVFSRRVMHEMMQRPSRKRPTKHRIRKVLEYQKEVKSAYEKYFRDHPEDRPKPVEETA